MSEHKHHQMTNSHLLVQEFDYLEPGSLEEAISMLSEYGDRAQLLAGGTYLLVQMKMERTASEYLINVGKLPELEGVSFQNGRLSVGALTKIRALRNTSEVQADYTALAEACAAFGSTQIQLMGTIGGNLCNGSPASDTVPALVAFGAELALAGPDGERMIPVEEFLVGPGKVALKEGELLVSVRLPPPPPAPPPNGEGSVGSAFIKISRVAADLAKASVAAVLVRDDDHIVDCRLAFGSVSPTVLRPRKAEELLIGKPFSAELALEAGKMASQEITPIDDVRSTAWYRREVVKAITHDVLQMAWERAGRGDKETRKRGNEETRREEILNTHHAIRNTEHEIQLTVNGVRRQLRVKPNELLLNVLRERLELTGSKYGCGVGECGACTVQLNGEPALACLVLAIAADGSEVLTVEGLQGADGSLDPLQEAFIEHNGFQCGYCTPGMLMMTKKLRRDSPSPTEGEIRDH